MASDILTVANTLCEKYGIQVPVTISEIIVWGYST